MRSDGRTYLDHNATSPLRPEARAATAAALDAPGNPSSVHRDGQRARAIVEDARSVIAAALGVEPASVTFTSGATEAAHLALTPDIRLRGAPQPAGRLLASAVEHPCVLAGGRFPRDRVARVAVDRDGRIDLDALERMVATCEPGGGAPLAAVMLANNETGVVQPVAEAARIVHGRGGYLLCDAVQAVGRMPLDIAELGADFVIVSAHKLGGPMGAGALIVADPDLAPAPLLAGGGQERGARAGTENVPAIAGFAAALEAATGHVAEEADRLAALRARLDASIAATTPQAVTIGGDVERLPNTTAFALPGVKAETLVIGLDLEGVAVSSGAACSSGKVGPSHVLEAMGCGPEIAASTVRVSLGWSTTGDDVDRFADAWARVAARCEGAAAA